MLRSLNASRSKLACAARLGAFQQRTFIKPTAALQVDFVQDMYLRELRAYKPTPLRPDDSEGHVQKFSVPKAPQSPEESNIANDLKAYEDQTVEVEGQAATGEASAVEEDWFEEEAEDDAHTTH